MAFIIVFSFASCGTEEQTSSAADLIPTEPTEEVATEVVSEIVSEVVTDIIVNEEGETEIVTEIVTEVVSGIVEVDGATDSSDEKDTSKNQSTTKKGKPGNNPSDWSKAEIVDFYKKACAKSSDVTSTQTMSMRKGTLTAAGGIGKFLGVAEPIIRAVLEANSTDFNGITGGYQDLVPSDCKTAKAYKSGNYTIVELTMVNQTDGVYGKKNSGTVGHAISVVDGVAEAVEQFPAFDIQYENADIKIYYTEAQLKVKINSNGVIEKGTWSYVVTPIVNDLYIENLLVSDAGAIVDYKVIVGGGF